MWWKHKSYLELAHRRIKIIKLPEWNFIAPDGHFEAQLETLASNIIVLHLRGTLAKDDVVAITAMYKSAFTQLRAPEHSWICIFDLKSFAGQMSAEAASYFFSEILSSKQIAKLVFIGMNYTQLLGLLQSLLRDKPQGPLLRFAESTEDAVFLVMPQNYYPFLSSTKKLQAQLELERNKTATILQQQAETANFFYKAVKNIEQMDAKALDAAFADDQDFFSPIQIATGRIKKHIEQVFNANKLVLQHKESEQRFVRTQINLHFMYKSIYNVADFIIGEEDMVADTYLTSFSVMMRRVIDNSDNDRLPLSDIIDTIRCFLELEEFRFKGSFSFSLDMDSYVTGNLHNVYLPTLLHLCFVENAALAGISSEFDRQHLAVKFSDSNGAIRCSIHNKTKLTTNKRNYILENMLALNHQNMDKLVILLNNHKPDTVTTEIDGNLLHLITVSDHI